MALALVILQEFQYCNRLPIYAIFYLLEGGCIFGPLVSEMLARFGFAG